MAASEGEVLLEEGKVSVHSKDLEGHGILSNSSRAWRGRLTGSLCSSESIKSKRFWRPIAASRAWRGFLFSPASIRLPWASAQVGDASKSSATGGVRARSQAPQSPLESDGPLEALRYLVVHELTHLIHRNHSGQFWEAVERELLGCGPK